MKRTRVKIVAVKEEPGKPCWPCIDHDADKELSRITTPIVELNPGMDFDIVSYTQLWQAEADYEADVEKYDGILVLLMTCWKGIDKFYAAQSKEGIPTIIADVPYYGSGSMLMHASPFVREYKLPVPLLSTLNYNEIAEAVRIFDVFAKLKQTRILVVTHNPDIRKKAHKPSINERCDFFAKEWGCDFVTKEGADLIAYMDRVDEAEAKEIAAAPAARLCTAPCLPCRTARSARWRGRGSRRGFGGLRGGDRRKRKGTYCVARDDEGHRRTSRNR